MEAEAYRLMAELEAEHWWYRGRRALIHKLLERLEIPDRAKLLDVGSGTGGNLAVLGSFGRVWGVEPSPLGQALGRTAWARRVVRGRAEELPFADSSFDVVAALDVLEHLHDDLQALDELSRVLRPSGHLILHVPAYAMLWGHEDVISKHLRRYRKGEIQRLLTAAGFEVEHLGYTNAVLLPLIAPIKIAKRLLVRAETQADVDRLPPSVINRLLTAVVECEAEIAASAELPFGASIVAAARKLPGS